MKTFKLSLIGLILFSTMAYSQPINAKNTTETSAAVLRAELMKMIQNPNLRQNGIAEANVQIQFTIGDKGELNIMKIDTESEYLAKFIKEKLEKPSVSHLQVAN